MEKRILILGAGGQIGTELVQSLREVHGQDRVIASDLRVPEHTEGPFVALDATDGAAVRKTIEDGKVDQVYLLAAMLSATAEKLPRKGWDLNMDSLFICLELAKEGLIRKLYWPSSIAAFGPTTPKMGTPQHTIAEPTTVYGISKFAGERWCAWYHHNHGVDVRSLRYPGLISYTAPPGGGTTDYAVDIFHQARKKGHYTSFLRSDTLLPMMYMPDAIRATMELMEAPAEQIKQRGSYNLAAFSFSPESLAQEIKKHLPDFTIDYAPDFRQAIADSWPQVINDEAARSDWHWAHRYDLEAMVADMLAHIK